MPFLFRQLSRSLIRLFVQKVTVHCKVHLKLVYGGNLGEEEGRVTLLVNAYTSRRM